jgi:hypothetical protein
MALLSPLPNDILRFEIVRWLTPPWRILLFEALTGLKAKQILVREYAEEICSYGEEIAIYAEENGLIICTDLHRAAFFYGWIKASPLRFLRPSFGWVLHAALGGQKIDELLPRCKLQFSYYELFQIYILTENRDGLIQFKMFWDSAILIGMALALTQPTMYLWLLKQLKREPYNNDLSILLNVSKDIEPKRRKSRPINAYMLSPTNIYMSGHDNVFAQYNNDRPNRLLKFLKLFKSFGMEPGWNMIVNFDKVVITTLIELKIPTEEMINWMISHDIHVAIAAIQKYHLMVDLTECIQKCITYAFCRGMTSELLELMKLGGQLTPDLYT